MIVAATTSIENERAQGEEYGEYDGSDLQGDIWMKMLAHLHLLDGQAELARGL